jgi:hypothetical protein
MAKLRTARSAVFEHGINKGNSYMSHRKLTVIFLCGLTLLFVGIMRAAANGTNSVNAQEMTFKSVETKAGWIVEGSIGNMRFQTREMTIQSGSFHHARVYADDEDVVLVWRNKDGSHGMQPAKKMALSIR